MNEIENKKILPICENPLLISSDSSNFRFYIIQAQGADIMPWVASKFINTKYCINQVWQFDILDTDDWYTAEKMFYFSSIRTDLMTKLRNKYDLFSIITKAISAGEYIEFNTDFFYIPEDECYNRFHRNIGGIVFGYDTDKNTIHFISFTVAYGTKIYEISYDDFYDSFAKENNLFGFIILKLNDKFKFETDFKQLYNNLYDFVNSTSKNLPLINTGDTVYGIKSLESLRNYFANINVFYEFIDKKIYSSFFDFQKATHIRLDYLKKIGVVKTDSRNEMNQKLKELSLTFYNNCGIYNQNKNAALLCDIIDQYDELCRLDTELSKIMLTSVKYYLTDSNKVLM